MVNLPIVYRQAPDAIASYDWVDLTSGVGYRTYYAAACTEDTAARYYLTPNNVMDSSTEGLADNTKGYAQTIANWDIDFDIEFGVAAIVGGGDAYVNLSFTNGATSAKKVAVTIYHYDGSTETSLGTMTHEGCPTASESYRNSYKIAITRKMFAVGDILRVNTVSSSDTNNATIYYDPTSSLTLTDKQGRTIGTDLVAQIPFVIDV